MPHVVVYGAGAALAQPIIEYYEATDWEITRLYRINKPYISRGIDLLVCCQGKNIDARLTKMTDEEWDAVLADNLTSTFRVIRDLAPRMCSKEMGGGSIVVLGSVVGSTGGYGCANYAASKAGLVGLVRSAALELASAGIVVNLLELGYLDAGMGKRLKSTVRERVVQQIPLGHFGDPQEVVRAVDFLAKTRYMTGNVLTLAGGLR